MAETESNSTTSSPSLAPNPMRDKRAPGRYLVPFHYEIDGTNGHHTWHCRVEEVDADGNVQQGPVQLHGIDTPALNRRHRGQHRRFLEDKVRPDMLLHYEQWKQDASDAAELKGLSL